MFDLMGLSTKNEHEIIDILKGVSLVAKEVRKNGLYMLEQ